MKYYERRKHLITKIVILIVVGVAIFFGVCDCAPKSTPQEITLTYERN